MRLDGVEKGELLYSMDGCQTFGTTDPEYAILEWEEEGSCRLAHLLNQILRSHALMTNVVDEYGGCSLLVRRLEPVLPTVLVQASPSDTEVTFLDEGGRAISVADAGRLPHAKPSRLEMMADAALQAARCLRAHLTPEGDQPLELRLTFGVAPSGECLLQAVNPLSCRLGPSDAATLCTRLGGDQR